MLLYKYGMPGIQTEHHYLPMLVWHYDGHFRIREAELIRKVPALGAYITWKWSRVIGCDI